MANSSFVGPIKVKPAGSRSDLTTRKVAAAFPVSRELTGKIACEIELVSERGFLVLLPVVGEGWGKLVRRGLVRTNPKPLAAAMMVSQSILVLPVDACSWSGMVFLGDLGRRW
uniref:(northern house mosquito) hypothetical protein n=1 Tax=Culex pipiens TaxID=7175 RepID=A0A8D8ASN4_CULPI